MPEITEYKGNEVGILKIVHNPISETIWIVENNQLGIENNITFPQSDIQELVDILLKIKREIELT